MFLAVYTVASVLTFAYPSSINLSALQKNWIAVIYESSGDEYPTAGIESYYKSQRQH